MTTDHFCSNYGTRKTQPIFTPNKQWAQSSSLAISSVYVFFNHQEPLWWVALCPEEGELPQHGSLLLTLLQTYIFLPHLLPFMQIKNIFRNFYIQANRLHSVSIWSSKSEHSQNVPDHALTCSCEGKVIFLFTHLQWYPHHFNIWLKTSLLACKNLMAQSTISNNISFCSPSYLLSSKGAISQSEVSTHLINHILYFKHALPFFILCKEAHKY